MDTATIRNVSIEDANKLGVTIPTTLPLLDEIRLTRTADDVVDRMMVMHAVAASAYGFDRQRARRWIDNEGLEAHLTIAESDFLDTGSGDRQYFANQIESMWALGWSISLFPSLVLSAPCAETFVYELPNLKQDSRSQSLREKASIRSSSEIAMACDMAYCLHWAMRDAQLKHISFGLRVEDYIIVERRRAFEWLMTNDNWDEVSLDT